MDKFLIIGSTAMYHWWPDEVRVPADVDILSPATVCTSHHPVHLVETQWNAASELIISKNKDKVFLDPDLLFTMKVSHAHWNIKWEKTMAHIHFLKSKGCQLDMEVYKTLYTEWVRIHGRKKVNMAQSTETFWNDAVKREYDHEYLHTLAAFRRQPWHEILRPDPNTVWCSEDVFNAQLTEHKYEIVLEEMMVVAIERSRLTANSNRAERNIAVNRSYKQLITSMTTGWFARFLILNQHELLVACRPLWETKLQSTLEKLLKEQS